MITELKVTLMFPQGASFTRNPQIELYRELMKLLRRISCVDLKAQCETCLHHSFCRYFQATGQNFENYPGILTPADWFLKNVWYPNEKMKLRFYFVGNLENYSSLAALLLQQLNHQLLGQFFVVTKLREKKLNLDKLERISSRLLVQTPIDDSNPLTALRKMIEYYNQNYEAKINLNFLPPDDSCFSEQTIKVILGKVHLDISRLEIAGQVGIWRVKEGFMMPAFLYKIGIGRNNVLGGGKIETEN